MENQFEPKEKSLEDSLNKSGVLNNLESRIRALLDKIDNGSIFKNIIDYVFKALAYLVLIFGALSCVINIFGEDGYFSRFDYLESTGKVTATIGFLIGLVVCLTVIYIVFTIIRRRAEQLKSKNYDGILNYVYEKVFPVLLVTFGEVLSVITLTAGILYVFANLLGSMVYFPLADIANTMSDVLDLGIAGDTQIFLEGNNWDYLSEGLKMAVGIIVLSPVLLVGTYVFKSIYDYSIKLIIKLIEFSISKNGILILFIGIVLSYVVINGFIIEIFEDLF